MRLMRLRKSPKTRMMTTMFHLLYVCNRLTAKLAFSSLEPRRLSGLIRRLKVALLETPCNYHRLGPVVPPRSRPPPHRALPHRVPTRERILVPHLLWNGPTQQPAVLRLRPRPKRPNQSKNPHGRRSEPSLEVDPAWASTLPFARGPTVSAKKAPRPSTIGRAERAVILPLQ